MSTNTNYTQPLLTPGMGIATGYNLTGAATVNHSTISSGQVLYNNDSNGKIEFTKPTHFSGDVTIEGISLKNALEKIQERLNIITPNTKLESEWEELRILGEQYRQLEKEILQKMAVYNELMK